MEGRTGILLVLLAAAVAGSSAQPGNWGTLTYYGTPPPTNNPNNGRTNPQPTFTTVGSVSYVSDAPVGRGSQVVGKPKGGKISDIPAWVPGTAINVANANNILETPMSGQIVTLAPCMLRMPHTHAADEFLTVLKGTITSGILYPANFVPTNGGFQPGPFTQTMTLRQYPSAGKPQFSQSVFYPNSWIHWQYNPTCKIATYQAVFNKAAAGPNNITTVNYNAATLVTALTAEDASWDIKANQGQGLANWLPAFNSGGGATFGDMANAQFYDIGTTQKQYIDCVCLNVCGITYPAPTGNLMCNPNAASAAAAAAEDA